MGLFRNTVYMQKKKEQFHILASAIINPTNMPELNQHALWHEGILYLCIIHTFI